MKGLRRAGARIAWIVVALGAVITLGTGCSNPCEKLADRICEKAGDEAPNCVQARERVEKRSGAAERQTCERVLGLLEKASGE